MSSHKEHVTKPEDRVPLFRKVGYGTGMLGYALLIQTYMQFHYPVFNDTLGLDAVLIGWVIAISRLWDAVTDPFMGNVTDNTRSRFGRRRPWIGMGAFICALSFIALWWAPAGQSDAFYFCWLLIGSLVYYLCFTIFSVPYIAMGMELSPDYHERSRVMSIRTILQQGGVFVTASLWWLTSLDRYSDMADGMRWNSLWMGALIFIVIAIPAIVSREHPSMLQAGKETTKKKTPLVKSVKETVSCWPFLNLALITVISLLGLMMVGSLGYYVTVYHIYDGVKSEESGRLLTIVNYAVPISTIIAVPLLQKFSTKVGKRKTLMVAFGISLVGTLLKWPFYTPDNPWLSIIPAVLMGFGNAAAYMFVNAMIPEAVDVDELKHGVRREGMFSAVYSWMFKIGAALALLFSGYILAWSGFDSDLVGPQSEQTIFLMRVFFSCIPAFALSCAIALAFFYPITEERAFEIRAELELQREKMKEAQ